MKSDMGEKHDKQPLPLDYWPSMRPAVPRYRRIFCYILLAAGIVVAILGLLVPGESARVNLWTAAGALVACGIAIRFQRVRR